MAVGMLPKGLPHRIQQIPVASNSGSAIGYLFPNLIGAQSVSAVTNHTPVLCSTNNDLKKLMAKYPIVFDGVCHEGTTVPLSCHRQRRANSNARSSRHFRATDASSQRGTRNVSHPGHHPEGDETNAMGQSHRHRAQEEWHQTRSRLPQPQPLHNTPGVRRCHPISGSPHDTWND